MPSVPVVVTNPDGQHVTLSAGFNYITQPPPSTGHPYFDSLVARADCVANYSLRSQAQINQLPNANAVVTYIYPTDPDPRKQDAAKIVINANSLSDQVRMPTNHTPRSHLLVTWDAWYGAECDVDVAKIPVWKGWNLCSPGESIYTEFRPRFQLAAGTPSMAFSDIRQYTGWGPNVVMGPVVGGRNYGSDAIGPMLNEFGQKHERWTRHWLYLRDDTDYYRLNLWMADPTQGPVQIYDDLQARPRDAGNVVSMNGAWNVLRLEYNTSTDLVQGPRPLICYARNVVMLKGISESQVLGLLQRPT